MSRPGYTYIRKYFTIDGRQYEVSGRTEAECYEKMGQKKPPSPVARSASLAI